MTAELADGWLPILFIPERARDVWGDSLDAGAAKRDPELGPAADQRRRHGRDRRGPGDQGAARLPAPDVRAVRRRHGRPRQELLQRARPALRLREGGQGDPGPLPRRQEEGGRGARPDGVDGGRATWSARRRTSRSGSPPSRRPASPTSRSSRPPTTRRRPIVASSRNGCRELAAGRLHSRARYDHLDEIRTLDPYDDADRDRIVTLTGRHDFPWDCDQGTAIAFLRDYGVPSIAALLDQTREFEDHGVKRYDDTLFFQEEAIVEGIDSERSHTADPAAEPDPRPLRHPQRRVPVRPGHHPGRPGALDQPLRLAASSTRSSWSR